jgi:hypothetical protein
MGILKLRWRPELYVEIPYILSDPGGLAANLLRTHRCVNAQTAMPAAWKAEPHPSPAPHQADMNLHLGLTPLISLLAGILILVMPRLLNYIVAIYLIAIGLIGLLGGSAFRLT